MSNITKLASRFEKIIAEENSIELAGPQDDGDDFDHQVMQIDSEQMLQFIKQEMVAMLDRLHWHGKPFSIELKVHGNVFESDPDYDDEE